MKIRSALLALALMVFGLPAFAQLRIVGAISGNVTDPSGAAVPGAKVVLKDEGTGITKEATATSEGTFLFPDLAHGSYQVTVSAPGFQTAVVSTIQVAASQTTDVPIRLTVGQQAETVTVEGIAPVLETTSQLVNTVQTTKMVNELPIIDRNNALQLARLAPGASPPTGGDTRFNNMAGGAVNVTVDGINDASNGYKSGGTVFYMTVPVRIGALEEVSVETAGLGADSGAESGANIKFITKRGTGQYHGSVFYQPNSEQFNANTWNNNARGIARAYNRLHNFGGNFGGKLVPFGRLKDKLFFFVNYEYVYNPQVRIDVFTVLNPAAQAGNYTYLVNGTTNQLATVNVLQIAAQNGAPTKLDPVTQSYIAINNKIPSYSTQLPTTDFNHTMWQWNHDNNLYAYYPTTRLDYYVTPREQLTFTWNYRHSWQTGYHILQDAPRINPFRVGYFVWAAALQSTISSNTFNEFRYGVQHSGDSNASATPGYGSFNAVNGGPLRLSGLVNNATNSNELPGGIVVPGADQQNTTGRHYITTIYDTVTHIRGQHTITAGATLRATDWKDTGESFPLPTYAFGTPSGDPLPGQLFTAATLPGDINTDLGSASGATQLYNLLTGRVASARYSTVVDPKTKQYGGFINYTWTRTYMGGLYIQDRWRVKPNLTLNYGLRWEAQGDMYDVEGITAVPDIKSIYGPSVALFTPGVLSGNNDPTAAIGRHPYPPDWLNFAPNVGVAWNPRSDSGLLGKFLGGHKTVFRFSYGITYYDEGTQFFAQNLGPNFGKTASQTLIAGQSSIPAFTTLSDLVAGPVPLSAFTLPAYQPVLHQANLTFNSLLAGMNPDLRAPYVENWSIGMQRELQKNTVLEVRYVGTQTHHAWRTSNLNEVNIFENGFLKEFQNAANNLKINQANGMNNSFANNGFAGQVSTPIFDAAFGPRGTVPAIAAASGYQNPTFISQLQNGQAGDLANTLATNQTYVCRMFGSNFSPCGRVSPSPSQQYNAPGPYPINFFLLNPFVAGTLNYVDDKGWHDYNGLQVQLRKQFSRGLQWTTNYTWSHALTNLPIDNSIQNVNWTTLRNESLDRQPSSFDIRHVIQTFGTYDLPVGRGRKLDIRNRFLDAVIGGWTTGSVLVWSTGQLPTINGATVRLAGNWDTVNTNTSGVILAPGVTLSEISDMFHGQPMQKVNQTGSTDPRLNRAGVTDQTRLAVPLSLIGPDGRANPQFVIPNSTPGQWGQFLYIYGKNNFSWDASLIKNFKIRERMTFQLYAAAANVLNHPTWGIANTNVFSTSFGTVGPPTGNRTMTFRGVLSF